MKRVACLSTIQSLSDDIAPSIHVFDIFNSTRAYNLENHILGSFIVSNQYLLMIAEGESTHLGNFIFKARHDKRIKDFSLIMNEEISEPEFSRWGIKLLKKDNESQERFFEKLLKVFGDSFKTSNENDTKRLKVFLDEAAKLKVKKTKTVEPEAPIVSENLDNSQYLQCMVSLSGWPKPGKVRLCPELIKICARLVGRPHRYEDLLQEQIVQSEDVLLKHLNSLQNLGIMKKHKVDGQPNLVGIKGGLANAPKKSSGDRFSTVLKNFLSASKHSRV